MATKPKREPPVREAGLWHFGTVFDHGLRAAGATALVPGFAVRPELDLAFALGWPHSAALRDDDEEDGAPVAALERNRIYDAEWPRGYAARWVRLRATGTSKVKADGTVVIAREGQAFANNGEPIARTECTGLLRSILYTSDYRADSVLCARLLEAFLGPDAFALAMTEVLESADPGALTRGDRDRWLAVRHLGFVLLRCERLHAKALVARLKKLVARRQTVSTDADAPIRAVDLAVSGREAVDRVIRDAGGVLDAHLVLLVGDDAAFVRQVVEAQDQRFLLPDARLLFVGGAALAKFYADHLPQVRQRERVVREFGAVKDPAVTELIRSIAKGKEARSDAQAWLKEYGN